MKPKFTLFAKGIIYLTAVAALSICVILLPELAREDAVKHPATAYQAYPFLAVAWALSAPFFVALYRAHKLLGHIDAGQAFSAQSIGELKVIKRCALVFGALAAGAAIVVIAWARYANPTEDVTHIVVLGAIIAFASGVIAAFAAVLQKLFTNAAAIKSENDLIV